MTAPNSSRLQTEADDLKLTWTVRWTHLEAPAQRFTLLLWRTLLGGVDYIFNISTPETADHNGTTRTFHIDNIKGDQKLIVDGSSDKFSVFLVGGIKIFIDMEYVVIAEVTTCSPFAWNVEAPGYIINVADIPGWRLQISPYSLRAGESYYITCRVYRNNTLVTQSELPFEVLNRGLKVYLSVDVLLVTIDSPFTVDAMVENLDYYEEVPTLVANASHVAPGCTLTWYFATREHLASFGEEDECNECQHGIALSDSLTIYSLEENFLNEITDFTNATEWRQVSAEMNATEGRARFLAECGCSLTFGCETKGIVYADFSFQLNPGPIVSPAVGTAMETVFRISRLAASDPDKPLLYTLLCNLGNHDTLVLGSNLEHLAVDTFLPYVGKYLLFSKYLI
ncbi:Uncharacterized protein OBRU01_16004 [Operophtera brumata]|uniref:Uncharacterized protein n=1 Tax=Operophtera brumata TaxID=104452 RepID=A0A0L7L4R1_OPEBR|nr:Uncharacterized protein OBRU01_16004 [Operophtera brumata]